MRLNLKVNMYNYPDTNIHNTLPKILKHRAESIPNTVALRDKDLGIWNEITWKEYNDYVSYLALSLSKRAVSYTHLTLPTS